MTSNSIQSHTQQKNQTGGILVISPIWNILHINQVACTLLQEVTPEQSSTAQARPFPIELFELADTIKESLLIERMAGHHHSIQVTRTLGAGSHKIVVKAFGLANPQDPLQDRILFSLNSCLQNESSDDTR